VGAIHGRLLTAWSAAGIVGPLIVNSVVESQKAAGQSGFGLYRLALIIMIGILVVGLVANLLIRRLDPRRFEDPEVVAQKAEHDREAAASASQARHGEAGAASASGQHTVAATALGLIVVLALLYGVSQTVLTAIGLFTG
jgi:predicted lipid-binding transport protein (Tim44 family)